MFRRTIHPLRLVVTRLSYGILPPLPEDQKGGKCMNRAGLTVCLWRKLSMSKSTALLNRLQCVHLSFCVCVCFNIFLLHVLFLISKGNHYSPLTAVSTIKGPDKCSNPVLFSRFLDNPYTEQWHHDWTIFELMFYTNDSFFF